MATKVMSWQLLLERLDRSIGCNKNALRFKIGKDSPELPQINGAICGERFGSEMLTFNLSKYREGDNY
ncbi:hypothetical protein [Burkholderia sp. BE12]|uniref:hypothetical protein n=1 Tax=Burkholderia sp. BE12 TaxID=2082394 RepID=UPI00131A33E0|nr:hypothetical protein [Burkholderia sp. BE12]